jgi:periplasmic protein TonB
MSMHALTSARATGYLDKKGRHPGLLTAAVAVHIGVLGAILSYHPEVIGLPEKPIVLQQFPPVTEPPPPEQKPKTAERQPKADPAPDRPVVIVPTEPTGPVREFWPEPQPQPPTGTGDGGGTVLKAEPAPPVLTLAELDPRYRGDVQPPYPPSLERMEIEGKVTVRLQIGTDGRVTSVELVRADDPGFFATTRDWALRRWRFKPATRDGIAVASTLVKTVSFRIVRA